MRLDFQKSIQLKTKDIDSAHYGFFLIGIYNVDTSTVKPSKSCTNVI